MSEAHRTVVLVRHAQAERQAASDAARRLTAKGLRDAAEAGRWLADTLGERPLLTLLSTAVRARITWDQMALRADVRARDGLYTAGTEEVLETLSMLESGVETAVVVGHNPAMANLVRLLPIADLATASAFGNGGFPTGAIAVLVFDGEWRDLRPARCRLVAAHTP